MVAVQRYRSFSVALYASAKWLGLPGPKDANPQSLYWEVQKSAKDRSIPGLYEIGLGELAERLGWSLEETRRSWEQLEQRGLALAEWSARVVFLPEEFDAPRPRTIKNIISWRNYWLEIPECELKLRVWRHARLWCETRGGVYLKAFLQACAEPLAEPAPEAPSPAEQAEQPADEAPETPQRSGELGQDLPAQAEPERERSVGPEPMPVPPATEPPEPTIEVPEIAAEAPVSSAWRRRRDPIVSGEDLEQLAAEVESGSSTDAKRRSDTLRVLADLRRKFTREKVRASEIPAYLMTLRDIAPPLLAAAARVWSRREHWFPQPAQLHRLARELEPRPAGAPALPDRSPPPPWVSAWTRDPRSGGQRLLQLAGAQ